MLGGLAYLNAGTDGPLPAAAVHAAVEELERELRQGRTAANFARRFELAGALRAAYAGLLGCDSADVALTTCTTEGIAQTVGGLPLQRGDEILTSDEEHPGLLGALGAARELHGVEIREVPLPSIADAVGPHTRLVACSHVGWMSGLLAPAELAQVDVPVLLDGAQGIGAVPVDIEALGCDAYAGAGQKWLCGPDGTGMLYVRPSLRERLRVARRGYVNLDKADAGVHAVLHADARRFDSPALSAETLACALAATQVLASADLARRARARIAPWQLVSPRRSPIMVASRRLATRRRSCPFRARTRPASAMRWRRRGSWCVTSLDGHGCGPPLERGTTRGISIGCWSALKTSITPQTSFIPRLRPRRAPGLEGATASGARVGGARWSSPGLPPPRAWCGAGPLGDPRSPPPGPERLREHLLLGRREVDAPLASQLRVRLLGPRRADID